jgi:hypothetical protein
MSIVLFSRSMVSAPVGEEHALPATGWCDVADVDDEIGELIEKDARLDVALRAFARQVEHDLEESLIGAGDERDQDVRGDGPGGNRDERHGAEQAPQADAARLHGHEFTISGQPPEGNQQRQQE